MDPVSKCRFKHDYETKNGHSGAPAFDSSTISCGIYAVSKSLF